MLFGKITKRNILIIAIVQIIFLFAVHSSLAQDSFIVLDSKNVSEMLENIKYIEDFGGKATHRFPPNVIIGDIPAENISKIKENIHVIKIDTIDINNGNITIDNWNVTIDNGNVTNNGSITKDNGNITNNGSITKDNGNITNNGSITKDNGNIETSAFNNSNKTINETNFGDQYGRTAEIAAHIWNNNYILEAEKLKNNSAVISEQKLSNENINIMENLSLINDTLIRPIPNEGPIIANRIQEKIGNMSSSISEGFSNDIIQSRPYGAGFYDTSDYLMGDVTVSIIFPESNGSIDTNIENWSSEEIQAQVGNVQKGLNWLANFDNRSKLTFTYDIKSQLPTSYEPVKRFPDDDNSWVTDIMNDIGYNKYIYLLDNVQDYDNSLRNIYKTDWAYTMFVIKSKSCQICNPTGHAYIGGPYAVVRDGLDYFDTVPLIAAHESGHIFYATDEYNGITEYSGYLNASDDEGSWCLMYTVWQPLLGKTCISSGTQSQFGWRDSDNNNIFDIIDSAPSITFDAYQPPSPLTFTGIATSNVTYSNNNPAGTKNGVTINKITKVIYNIDNGIWSTATPLDGSGYFDGAIEGFTFTIPQLSDGIHTIKVGTVNTVGYWAYDNKNITVNSGNNDKLNLGNNSGSDNILKIGQSIISQDGRYKLIMQEDGNLVLYNSGITLWSSNTVGNPGAWLTVQEDGNAVIYDNNNKPLWATGTWGHAGAWLMVQNDGNVVVYDINNQPLWATGTNNAISYGKLNPGDSLKIGQSLISQNGRFKLVMQEDGNLVLYEAGGSILWSAGTKSTGTNGKIISNVIMQNDGNFVIYGSNDAAWDIGTWGHPGSWLIVQNDGNVVIYDANNKPLWATGTNR